MHNNVDMGEYVDIKPKILKKFIKKLSRNNKHLTILKGGNHNELVKYDFWKRPFPIPFKHQVVNKHIVKDLMKLLVEENICTKEEFDSGIK